MAKSVKVSAGGCCNCLNPAFKYLENKLITAENIAKLFARARKVDRSLHGSEPVSMGQVLLLPALLTTKMF